MKDYTIRMECFTQENDQVFTPHLIDEIYDQLGNHLQGPACSFTDHMLCVVATVEANNTEQAKTDAVRSFTNIMTDYFQTVGVKVDYIHPDDD